MTKNRELDEATAKRVERHNELLAGTDAMREALKGAVPKDVLAGLGDPTPELAAKHQVVETETMAAGRRQKRVETQRVLDRYLIRGQISQRQHDAGDRLYRTYVSCGGLMRLTASYEIRVDGRKSDALTSQLQAVEQLERAKRFIGRQFWPALVAVCLYDKSSRDWAIGEDEHPDSGMNLLRRTLDRLADLYARSSENRAPKKSA